jgi:hypothetical protein
MSEKPFSGADLAKPADINWKWESDQLSHPIRGRTADLLLPF